MHTLLCVCPPRVESLFPPVLLKSYNQILLAFKVWFFGNSSSHCQTPRLGSLTWGSEPSLHWADFYGIIVLQFVSHEPSSYGIWFYCDCAPPTVSLQPILCLWMWGIFFGEFQCLPVDDCSAVSCDFGALTRGSERTSFYSAILNQSHTFSLLIVSSKSFTRQYGPWDRDSATLIANKYFRNNESMIWTKSQLGLVAKWQYLRVLLLCHSGSNLYFS